MDDYVSKLEKRSCMVLPLSDFLIKASYAPKMADYGLISYFFFNITYSYASLASNLSIKLLLKLKQDLCKVNRMISDHWLISVLGLIRH